MDGSGSALSTIVELVLGAGGGATLLGIAQTIIQRLTGKRDRQMSAAQAIQAMSLNMLEPLHAELESTHQELEDTRKKTAELRDELDQLLIWARAANRELRAHGLSVGPIPLRAVRQQEG